MRREDEWENRQRRSQRRRRSRLLVRRGAAHATARKHTHSASRERAGDALSGVTMRARRAGATHARVLTAERVRGGEREQKASRSSCVTVASTAWRAARESVRVAPSLALALSHSALFKSVQRLRRHRQSPASARGLRAGCAGGAARRPPCWCCPRPALQGAAEEAAQLSRARRRRRRRIAARRSAADVVRLKTTWSSSPRRRRSSRSTCGAPSRSQWRRRARRRRLRVPGSHDAAHVDAPPPPFDPGSRRKTACGSPRMTRPTTAWRPCRTAAPSTPRWTRT